MKNLRWTDNTCYVDRTRTCLHAWLTQEDMDMLRTLFNGEVSFTPTSNEQFTNYLLTTGKEAGHYIDCRTTHPAFGVLLVMTGRVPVRGEAA